MDSAPNALVDALRHRSGNGFDGNHYTPDQLGDAYEAPAVAEPEPPPLPGRFTLLPSAQFVRADYRLEWLVKRLLVRGQPAVIAGPKKGMKTSTIVDLGVSLATGEPFLDEFCVYKKCRTAIFSGESGEATLQETFLRIAKAKEIDPATAADNLLWGFDLPQFTEPNDLEAFSACLAANQVEVAIVDPLYLCVLGTYGKGPQASNAFQMGPLYKSFADACLRVGATPILAAHFKITLADPTKEPELNDLSHAGIQEFVRQWLLIGRKAKYEPGTGQHRLWLSVGGSSGQSGLWSLEIDEGTIDEEFQGRFWDVRVSTATEARQADRSQREQEQKEKKAQQDRADEDALMRAIDKLASEQADGVAGYTQARDLSPLSGRRMAPAVARLKERGIAEEVPPGAQRKGKGLRRVSEKSSPVHPSGPSKSPSGRPDQCDSGAGEHTGPSGGPL